MDSIVLLNQGCQTHADVVDIFVSSEGELLRKGELVVGSLNLNDVAGEFGFTYADIVRLTPESNPEVFERWRQAVDAAWERLYQATCTVEEYRFLKKVLGFSGIADFGRFRVYGEVNDGKELVLVVTEFVAFVDEQEFWERLAGAAYQLGAYVWIMRESPYLDKSRREDETEWQFGENHGRMERQVELSWSIQDKTPEQFQDFLEHLREQTQELYSQRGVGVC